MTRCFLRQLRRGEPEQFVINQRQQFLRGLRVTLLEGAEDLRVVTHTGTLPRKGRRSKLEKLEKNPPAAPPANSIASGSDEE
jgi:hypothetical protein